VNEFILNEDQSPLERRADELRADVLDKDPITLAESTGTRYQDDPAGAFFEFLYWGNPVHLSKEDYIARSEENGKALPAIHQAMILYYFSTSIKSAPAGKWISFSELADGQFYNAAFQGYTSKKLLQYFGDQYQLFEDRCVELCGDKHDFGDGAFRYQILPRIAILAVYWKGDEDFPPSYKILFEDIADDHMPTDGCAILGSMLTGKLTQEYS
jgi:hypothetical protein